MSQTIVRFVFLFLAVCALNSSPAYAADPEKYVQVRLLASQTQVEGGETITIGIEQDIHPHWHVYWLNPGDSGAVTEVEWDMPRKFKAGKIEWPVPIKLPYGPLTNYGYEDKVTLLQDITLPKNIPDGPITLTANVDLLVCEEICIPESHVAQLTLNGDTQAEAVAIEEARAKLPLPVGWKSTFKEDGEDFVLNIETNNTSAFENLKGITFFPEEWGLVDNNAAAKAEITDTGLRLTQTRGDRHPNEAPVTKAVISYKDPQGQTKGIRISALWENGSKAALAAAGGNHASGSNIPVWQAIIFALLGGLILNLMPCVFPVLSIKALSLVKLKDKEETKAKRYGLAYTAGILATFGLIAGLLIALKAAGAQIGWGFQLQHPTIIILLSYLVFLIGLNLSGFFEFTGRLGNVGSRLASQHGYAGSFFTGALAAIVATPCTAPFMGAAMGFALTQPAFIAMTVFLALGLGLALPYLALCYVPAFRHKLPKPGAWMETFRQFLAFPMFATAAWLVWVLSQQVEAISVFSTLLGMIAIAFVIWLFKVTPTKGAGRTLTMIVAAAALVYAVSTPAMPLEKKMTEDQVLITEGDNWDAYTAERLEDYLQGGHPVFVNMTAAWCITCKVNEKLALSTKATKKLFTDKGVKYLKGDWTNRNAEITKYLNEYGRSGVPIYVYYGPRDEQTGERPEPVVLPQILTPGIVSDTIQGSQT